MVVFAQSLPGATSSKVGIMVGTHRAGLRGGVAAWLGFTLPSALILMAFGLAVNLFPGDVANAGWLHGLKIAAVVIVFQAVLSMGQRLAPDRERATLAIGAAIVALAVEGIAAGQVLIIAGAALLGWVFLRKVQGALPRVSIAATSRAGSRFFRSSRSLRYWESFRSPWRPIPTTRRSPYSTPSTARAP